MIRPLLRRPSQIPCGYVCRQCRHSLAQQSRPRHTNAFSTSTRRRALPGELEETNQDYFGGFNDLSEEYSSSKFTQKTKENKITASQGGKVGGSGQSASSPARIDDLRAKLAQRVDGEKSATQDEGAGTLVASSTLSEQPKTAFAKIESLPEHPLRDLPLVGQLKIERGVRNHMLPRQKRERRELLATVGICESGTSLRWLTSDGTEGQVLTDVEIAGKREELAEKLKQLGQLPAAATSMGGNVAGEVSVLKNEEAKTAFIRAQPRSKHPLHGLSLIGQLTVDRGKRITDGMRRRRRRQFLAKNRLAERDGVLIWRNGDGTFGQQLTATQVAVTRRRLAQQLEALRPGQTSRASSCNGTAELQTEVERTNLSGTHITDGESRNETEGQPDARAADRSEHKPQEAGSSQRETFEAILANLQAELPNIKAALNATKQENTAALEKVDVPATMMSGNGTATTSVQEKSIRVENPFSRPVDAVNVSSGVTRDSRAREAEPKGIFSSHPMPGSGAEGLVSKQPSQKVYNFSRQTSDLGVSTLAAQVRETNARNAAWGGIAPATKPAGEIKVDSDSLRAMDSISRIIPRAASPGQKKAWGQEVASAGGAKADATNESMHKAQKVGKAPLSQPQIASSTDNSKMLSELDRESDTRSRSEVDRPNTRVDLSRSGHHTFDELKAKLAQSMDANKPSSSVSGAQQTPAKEQEKPKKQVSMFQRLVNGLRGAASNSRHESTDNDDALSGHLASGKRAAEKRREEESSTNVKTVEQPLEKPTDNASERLAKLHQRDHAEAANLADTSTQPVPDDHSRMLASEEELGVEADDQVKNEGDDTSAAGQELMTIRKQLSESRRSESEVKRETSRGRAMKVESAKAAKQKSIAEAREKQMNIKEAMQQATQSPKRKTSAQRIEELLKDGAGEHSASKDEPDSSDASHGTPASLKDIKSIFPAELAVNNLNIPQPDVPPLQYGLDRVLFNPGVYQLQDPHSRVYNFDPYLQKITPIKDFDFNALKEYKTSSQDKMLSELAQKHGKKYVGSTSSMTGTLAHFHYLLSNWRELNLDMLSRGFHETLATFTQINRAPNAIFLRWKNGTYAIDADKEYDGANVLMMLGKSMEKLLTAPREEYERYTRGSSNSITPEEKDEPESYEYTSMGDFLMRSQLDAYDPRLPGKGTFDLKTRAVVSIRMDVENFEPMVGYELHTLQGKYESYEREYYDMMRSTMLKYMLQARMGRMDGIFVAYHNIERMFGFQYLPMAELDRAIHGQIDRCLGDQEFTVSLKMLNEVFEMATEKFPEQSLRFHFESADKPANMMWVFAEPVTEHEADAIQNKSKAKVAEFERSVMGIEKGSEEERSAVFGGKSGEDDSLQANSKTATVVHSDPLSAYAAATAKPASPPRDSDPDITDNPSGSHADVSFMKKLSSDPIDHTKPLFAATIILRNYVNGQACENNRPCNLTKSDEWRVEYILKESKLPAQDNWARYEDLKARRRKVFEREDAGLEEEGGGSAEMSERIKSKAQQKSDGYIKRLRELAERGREFRSKVDKLEEGKEKVVLGMPGVKADASALEMSASRNDSAVDVSGQARGAQTEVRDVESYMNWSFSAADEKASHR